MRQLWRCSVKDKILIKNLYECKGCNAWHFITKFLNKGWTKNSINRLLVKFGTVDRRLSSGRRSACTDENVDTVGPSWVAVAESRRQTSEPPNSQKISREAGGSTDHQFRGLFIKICVSSPARKGALNSWLKRTACTRYFRYAVWDDNVITSKPTWKPKYANSILESCDLCIIKIDPYHFELYHFKVGRFFWDSVQLL